MKDEEIDDFIGERVKVTLQSGRVREGVLKRSDDQARILVRGLRYDVPGKLSRRSSICRRQARARAARPSGMACGREGSVRESSAVTSKRDLSSGR